MKSVEGKVAYELIDRKSPEIISALASAPIYKKQGHVHARAATAGEKIMTTLSSGATETENTSHEESWIITNPSGEQYILPAEQFYARYEPTDQMGVYAAKGFCRAIRNPFGRPIEIMSSWDSLQFGEEDCMIADTCEDENGSGMDGEPYLIGAAAFSETYI